MPNPATHPWWDGCCDWARRTRRRPRGRVMERVRARDALAAIAIALRGGHCGGRAAFRSAARLVNRCPDRAPLARLSATVTTQLLTRGRHRSRRGNLSHPAFQGLAHLHLDTRDCSGPHRRHRRRRARDRDRRGVPALDRAFQHPVRGAIPLGKRLHGFDRDFLRTLNSAPPAPASSCSAGSSCGRSRFCPPGRSSCGRSEITATFARSTCTAMPMM